MRTKRHRTKGGTTTQRTIYNRPPPPPPRFLTGQAATQFVRGPKPQIQPKPQLLLTTTNQKPTDAPVAAPRTMRPNTAVPVAAPRTMRPNTNTAIPVAAPRTMRPNTAIPVTAPRRNRPQTAAPPTIRVVPNYPPPPPPTTQRPVPARRASPPTAPITGVDPIQDQEQAQIEAVIRFDELTLEEVLQRKGLAMVAYKVLFNQMVKAVSDSVSNTNKAFEQGFLDKFTLDAQQKQWLLKLNRLKILFMNAYDYDLLCFNLVLTPTLVQNFDMQALMNAENRQDQDQARNAALTFLRQMFASTPYADISKLKPLTNIENIAEFIEQPGLLYKNTINEMFLPCMNMTPSALHFLYPLTESRKKDMKKYCADRYNQTNECKQPCRLKKTLSGTTYCTRMRQLGERDAKELTEGVAYIRAKSKK